MSAPYDRFMPDYSAYLARRTGPEVEPVLEFDDVA